MKKVYLVLIALAATLFLASCSNKETLVLYLPNDYINEDLIKEFEQLTNSRVKYPTFNNNEVALGLIKSQSYDLVIPSDYAIEELAKENLLTEIDYRDFVEEGFEFAPGLTSFLDQLREDGFDFLNYAVPYFWGSLGILYNSSKVTLETLEEKGYGVIADPSLQTIIYESARDALMVGLLNVDEGILLEDATPANILSAEAWLKNAYSQDSTTMKSDEILDEMLSGTRYDAVIAYSGDAAYIMSENPNYNFYLPTNTNVWADGFVIPNNAKNPELAKEFIKFMLTYDSALANTEEIGYSASRNDVFVEMISEGGTYSEPRLKTAYEAVIADFQVFRSNDTLKKLIDDSWERVIASS